MKLQGLVKHFENNNEEYTTIRKTAEGKVHSTLSDQKMVLKLALLSLTDSMKNDPDKYSHLIYNITPLQQHEHKQRVIILLPMDNSNSTHHRLIQICYWRKLRNCTIN